MGLIILSLALLVSFGVYALIERYDKKDRFSAFANKLFKND